MVVCYSRISNLPFLSEYNWIKDQDKLSQKKKAVIWNKQKEKDINIENKTNFEGNIFLFIFFLSFFKLTKID